MQTKLIRSEEKSNRHHKDTGNYFLTEFRTSTGRLLLAEGRTQNESEQAIRNMLRDEAYNAKKRQKAETLAPVIHLPTTINAARAAQ